MKIEESKKENYRPFTEGIEKGNKRFITSPKPIIKGNLWKYLKKK